VTTTFIAERLATASSPGLGEDERVHAPHDVAELVDRLIDLTPEPVEHLAVLSADRLTGEVEVDMQRQQPLLRGVV
jgi:hypothetical protein